MKKLFIISLILLISQINIFSNSSIDILKNDISAKIISLGGSGSVVNNDIFSINYNPGTLSLLNKPQIGINYSNGFEDASYSYIAFGSPLPTKIISNISYPYLGMSIYISNLGDLTNRTIQSDGRITEKTINAEKNTIITIAYSEKINSNIVIISPQLKSKFDSGIGLGVKIINSKLLEKYSATAIAVDGGYYGNFVDLGLDFGISLLNTIGSIKYIEEKYNLPTTFKIGTSYSKPTVMDQWAKVYLEFDRYVVDKKSSLRLGVEYTIENMFSARVGYKLLDENNGLSIGFGFLAGNFSCDIATVFYDIYKYSSLSIKYSFGTIEEKKEHSKELKKYIEKEEKKQPRPTNPSSYDNQIIVF